MIRDDVAAREGALCFDVGSSGVMDKFPALVIRGIHDYADTHPRPPWRGYAAMAASAYAAGLLRYMPSEALGPAGNSTKTPQSLGALASGISR